MGLCSCCCRCLELLCSVLLPPLGVCLRHGCCSVSPALSSPSLLALLCSYSPLPFWADGVLDQCAAHHPRLPPRRPLRRVRHLLRRPPPPPRQRRLRLRSMTRWTGPRGALVRVSAATSVLCAVCIFLFGLAN